MPTTPRLLRQQSRSLNLAAVAEQEQAASFAILHARHLLVREERRKVLARMPRAGAAGAFTTSTTSPTTRIQGVRRTTNRRHARFEIVCRTPQASGRETASS